MMEALRAIGTVIGGSFVIWYATAKVFKLAGEAVGQSWKARVTNWLKGQETRILDASGQPVSPVWHSWPESFARLFDQAFGEKQLSWKCFLRSCRATIVVSLIFYLLVMIKSHGSPMMSFMSFINRTASEVDQSVAAGWFVIIWMISMTLIPDYISLGETRWVLGRMKKASSGVIVSLLVADFILTILIVFCSIGIFALIFAVLFAVGMDSLMIPDLPKIMSDALELAWNAFTWNPEFDYFTPPVYSTFLTSIWIWLFVISGLLVKTAVQTQGVWHRLRGLLDIDNQPFLCIGIVAGLILAIVWAALTAIWLASS